MSRRLLGRWADGTRFAGFEALNGDSGIANLPQSLTINSQTVAPTFIYRGTDATASAWPALVGDNLSIAGSGSAPSLNQPALGNGANDESWATRASITKPRRQHRATFPRMTMFFVA
jgi:hypothetical protein